MNSINKESLFAEEDIHSVKENVFKMIEDDWMLITAGTVDDYNTMTANWGGFGFLWHKNICSIYVRPTRYTYEFTEKNELFTLSFFEDKYREQLEFCGAFSGRDVNKADKCGFTPVELSNGISFEQANLVFVCKKIYYHDIDPKNFLSAGIEKNYPLKDYHRMYLGEIIKFYKKIL